MSWVIADEGLDWKSEAEELCGGRSRVHGGGRGGGGGGGSNICYKGEYQKETF